MRSEREHRKFTVAAILDYHQLICNEKAPKLREVYPFLLVFRRARRVSKCKNHL